MICSGYPAVLIPVPYHVFDRGQDMTAQLSGLITDTGDCIALKMELQPCDCCYKSHGDLFDVNLLATGTTVPVTTVKSPKFDRVVVENNFFLKNFCR
jgi:hypothetical protein